MEGDSEVGLAQWFVRQLPNATACEESLLQIETSLARAIGTAREAWPELQVDTRLFLAHVARHLSRGEDLTRALTQLFVADLFLACGCAHGEPQALACFEKTYLAKVVRTLGPGHPLGGGDEVIQCLRERLLVATDSAPPRIATYSGRGPLAVWVHMAAIRLAINLRKAEQRGAQCAAKLFALRAPQADPELEYLKACYATEVEEAFRVTLSALSPRLGNVVRLHYLEGVPVGAVGTIYRVSGRTVQRWLSEARRTILDETRRRLCQRLKLAEGELDSLLGMVRSRLDLGIFQHLPQRP
jgi:RNA polymerase sigma-70 factor (ECF subfamily)